MAVWSTWAARLLVGLLGVFAGGSSDAAPESGDPAAMEAALAVRSALDAEGSLLHRRVDLSAVMCWQRQGQTWRPLGGPPERLRVVNLWSAQCKPCVEELPLLRRMTAAWRHDRGVRFLFIADPPHDTEAAEVAAFWSQHAAAVPDSDPCRSTTDRLRAGLGNGAQPITLLLDEEGVVRQAFVGSVHERGLASAMERLLRVLATPRRPR